MYYILKNASPTTKREILRVLLKKEMLEVGYWPTIWKLIRIVFLGKKDWK